MASTGKIASKAIKRVQGGGRQLAEDHVVPFQIGEKQQSECSLPFLAAETIRRGDPAGKQAVNDGKHAKQMKHLLPQHLLRRAPFCDDKAASD